MDNDNKCENESENTNLESENTIVESENTIVENETTIVENETTNVENETTNVESETTNVESENTNVESETTNVESENKKIKKKKTSKKKEEKLKFEAICSHCSKVFKNNKLYEKHTNEQVCYKENEITYCKLCQINCNNHNDYKKHLFTLEHINNIGCNTIEKIQNNTISTVHTLDPYLNNNDIAKIATKNLGNSFTFVYEKGNTQTITLKQEQNTNNKIQKNIINNNINENHFNTQNSFNTINNIISPDKIETQSTEPTLRQTKIINFLISQTNKTIDESGKLFYKMLDDKLRIEDYKGLQRIIKHLDINEEYKNNYLNTVDIFIKVLVKETTMGKTVYKDKHISELVINLTS